MGSVKVVLRKKINKNGTYPLAIRITKDRKSSFIHIGQNLKESQWDSVQQKVKKSHPNSARLNNFIIKKLSEANEKLLEVETQKSNNTSQSVRRYIKHSSPSSGFFNQAESYINNLKKSGKYNRLSAEQPRINRFRDFLKREDIAFQDITVPLLNRFRSYLKGTRNIGERTIVNHLVVLRSIFNQAIKEGIIDQKYYPFGKDKIRIKFPDSLKIGLTEGEVKQLEELQLNPNSLLNHARNIWLFSFYFAGMRISDVLRLRWSDFKDERLHYTMGKNIKGGSLKIPNKATKILDQYKQDKEVVDDLIFPELKEVKDLSNTYLVQKRIATSTEKLNKLLKKIVKMVGIEKKLTMHIARHTFGNISGDKISIQMLQKLYRHSSVTTTIAYQSNFIHKDADEALDAVVDF